MVKPADLGERDDFALVRHLNGTHIGAIHGERQMRAILILIGDVFGKNPPQMILTKYDDVVQTLAPYASVESFCIRVLPGTMRHS